MQWVLSKITYFWRTAWTLHLVTSQPLLCVPRTCSGVDGRPMAEWLMFKLCERASEHPRKVCLGEGVKWCSEFCCLCTELCLIKLGLLCSGFVLAFEPAKQKQKQENAVVLQNYKFAGMGFMAERNLEQIKVARFKIITLSGWNMCQLLLWVAWCTV